MYVFIIFFPGSVFGSKDYFIGLAVFLDTYANQNEPHSVSSVFLVLHSI